MPCDQVAPCGRAAIEAVLKVPLDGPVLGVLDPILDSLELVCGRGLDDEIRALTEHLKVKCSLRSGRGRIQQDTRKQSKSGQKYL